MFEDVKIKTRIYKEKIIKEYVNRGKFPTSNEIKNELANIDPYVSIYKHKKTKEGEFINIEKLNEEYRDIYADLCVIYEVLYKTSIKELLDIEAYASSHIKELESYVNTYKRRADIEVNSTSLGKTLLFQDHGFDISNNLATTTINLGKINARNKSKVSFIVNANNIENYKISCFIKRDGKQYTSTPYNMNQESIYIDGEIDKNTYDFKIDENQIMNYPFEIKINKDIDQSKYYVFAGQNKISMNKIEDDLKGNVQLKDIGQGVLETEGKGIIEFYIVDGNNVEFTFNKPPLEANFNTENRVVNNLNEHHYFKIEYDEGFVFSMTIDSGKIFAMKDNSDIIDKKLYFSKRIDVRDFYIEEYKKIEGSSYDAYVDIYNKNDEPIKIDSILIKELFYLEEI